MKVDKGVCTTNDDDGAVAASELSSIIKFETVFTTLVENKILAIKRECEQHESKKKSRTLRSILLRKKTADGETTIATADGQDEDAKKSKTFSLRSKRDDVERGGGGGGDGEHLVSVVVVRSENEIKEAKLDSQSNELVLAAKVDNASNCPVSSAKLTADDKQNHCDKLFSSSHTTEKHAQVTLSTPNDNDASAPEDESLATTIDLSLQQSSVVAAAAAGAAPAANNNNNNNHHHPSSNPNNNIDKSDVAICDDGASSQNTSDIEFSLVSENSLSEHTKSKRVMSNLATTVTNSDPVSKHPKSLMQKREKAKSCHSTPIFGRHKQHARSESEGKKVLTFTKEPAKEPPKQKSQTIVTAATTATTAATTTLISTVSGPQLESVHAAAKRKHSLKHRDVSIEYEITYDDGNESPAHGFISSFNQLTSQKPPAAIISANLKKQARDTEKTATNHEIELELDDLGVDVVASKKKKRRRQSSRSESVSAAPATGLKHCILSRPPNQPIQIDYDPGLLYDVSLQIESEFNGDIKSIVPAEHKRHRRKHHHDHEKCRKKRKKRKILVHNLDDKSLKMIDPDSDELPQRAKFTIVATACLLLIMCLLLVGVTLRMAPLIDDMVRQENERLLQDSLNRAKMAVNFTDPPPLSPSTMSNHPTANVLHQHPNFP